MGDVTVPCCNPSVISKVSEEQFVPSHVISFLLVNMFQIRYIKGLGQLNLLSINVSPLSQTESKAFSMSIRQAPTIWLLCSALLLSDKNLFNAWVVE